MKRSIVIIIISIVLSGCITQYQKKEYSWDVGYSETQLDENIFRVSYTGNEFYTEEKTIDYTLLRSAEITIENGYKYFAVINQKSSVEIETTYIQPTYQTYSTGYGSSTTYSYGGGVFTSSSPSANNTILLFKDKQDDGILYNAEFVAKSIRKKYEMK